jgi:hypothetical protein
LSTRQSRGPRDLRSRNCAFSELDLAKPNANVEALLGTAAKLRCTSLTCL